MPGKTRMRQIARGLAALGVDVDLVLTSPFVRAADTAAILARGLDTRPDVVTCPALAPTGTPARIVEALAAETRAQRIALVGHEPALGELAAWLIGARTPPRFKKGGVARIDVAEWPPARQGTLMWLATPAMLRSVK